ncbi:MAG: putative transcriptional regulator, partial [Myxococcota bacterium]
EWHGDTTTRVYCGGPVERQRGWLLHEDESRFEGSQVIDAGLGITTSQDGLTAFGKEPEGQYRLVLGYSGWSAGQLDQEITAGTWITAPIDPALVFMSDRDKIWATALRSVGVDPDHLFAAGTQLN